MTPRLVGFTLVSAAAVFAACTSHTNPVAAVNRALVQAADTVTIDSFPFMPNVHVAALPTLPDTLRPAGFNDIGEVVGYLSGRVWHWEGSRGLQFFTNPPGTHVGDAFNTYALNNLGDVAVAIGPDTSSTGQAAYFDWYGVLHYLRPLSKFTPDCGLFAINDHREALGYCAAGAGYLPTIWTPSGNPVPIEPGGGAPYGVGTWTALSNSGYLFGDSITTGLLFTPQRQLRHLSPAFYFISGGLNDNGQVTGSIFDGQHGVEQAAAWFSDTATTLGVHGVGWAISDDSIVAGISDGSYTGTSFGWVWTPHTGVQRLPGLEGFAVLNKETLNGTIMFMNRKRQIIAQMTKSDGHSVTYVMWTLPATITRGTPSTFAVAR